MKKIYLLLAFTALMSSINAQSYYATSWDEYEGLWEYAHNDTIFRIKLKKGEIVYRDGDIDYGLFGGYSLKVNNIMREDYIGTLPAKVISSKDFRSYPKNGVYIESGFTYSSPHTGLGFRFFDQRKKHIDGKGILSGGLNILSPNTLHWTLDEAEGLWEEYEGDSDRVMPDPIGFSVPTDVIMTRVIE